MNNDDRFKVVSDLINSGIFKMDDNMISKFLDLDNIIFEKSGGIQKRRGYENTLNTNNLIQRKWFINKNETIYFWHSYTQTYSCNFTWKYFQDSSDSFKIMYNLSQEEIDQIMKEIKEEQNQLSFGNITNSNQPIFLDPLPYKTEVNGNKCIHKMKEYTGLFEKYNFCEKCGEKEK